jgi:hypothetical protein
MRSSRYPLLLLCVGLVGVRQAHAGVYTSGESETVATYPDFMDSPTGKNFRDVLMVLRGISVPLPLSDSAVRQRHIFQEELLTKNPTLALKMEDRLQGSAVLIRRRKFKDAEALLRPVATTPDEQDNLPLQSNFANALHMQGDLVGAYDTLEPVVNKYWQTSWETLPEPRQQLYKNLGWSDAVYDLYREYDGYYLKLLRLRKRERRDKKESSDIVQPPDALFDDGKDPVRFVGEGGEFTAGRISSAESAKLPVRALAIVQQLLVWMPDDYRLYWLLGELYNAQKPTAKDKENESGIRAAHQIFSELSRVAPEGETKKQLERRLGILTSAIERFELDRTDPILKEARGGGDKKDAAGFPIDWRTVAISFGVGFVLALFVTWQVREIQRRRQARFHQPRSAESMGQETS